MKKTSEQFYKELGVEKLKARKEKIHTRKELSYLKKLLSKKKRILDLACGYGRFTIALANQGYNIEGIDISLNLLKEAKKKAKKENLNLKFKLGDMRKLPYKDKSFDIIICMWSAFTELDKEKDQIKTIKEMFRVLDENGFALLEIPYSRKTKNKVIVLEIEGIVTRPMFVHNKITLRNLMKKADIKKYKIFIDNFGGRKRLFVQFWK